MKRLPHSQYFDILPFLKEGDSWSSQTKFLIHSKLPLVAQVGLTFAPQAWNPVCPTVLQLICLNPSSSMFFAADTSRSCSLWQWTQRHTRSDNLSCLWSVLQSQHCWLLGKNRSIFTNCRPYQSLLYFKNRMSIPHPASAMLRLKCLFFIIFFTARSSMQMTWFSFTNLVLILWR